jgi:hypothetical protein
MLLAACDCGKFLVCGGACMAVSGRQFRATKDGTADLTGSNRCSWEPLEELLLLEAAGWE